MPETLPVIVTYKSHLILARIRSAVYGLTSACGISSLERLAMVSDPFAPNSAGVARPVSAGRNHQRKQVLFFELVDL
jgi:hypothetical protein